MENIEVEIPSFLAGAPTIPVELVTCGVCFCAEAKNYSSSYDYEYGTCANKWRFVQCEACNNIYLNPRPTPHTLQTIYPTNYYSYQYETQIHWLARKAKQWLDKKKFLFIQKNLIVKIRRYIDIGCGTGRYLRLMESQGLHKKDIIGFELSQKVVDELKRDGFEAYCGFFEDIGSIAPGSVQLITLFSVLEHLPSPMNTVKKAHLLLEKGGMLVFEVPNPRSTNARWFKNEYWGGYHTPRHWNLFDIETVKKQFLPVGFELVKLKRSTGHAFWLWSLHNWFLKRGNNKIAKFFHPSRCIPGLLFFTCFDIIRGWFNFETDNNIFFLKKI